MTLTPMDHRAEAERYLEQAKAEFLRYTDKGYEGAKVRADFYVQLATAHASLSSLPVSYPFA